MRTTLDIDDDVLRGGQGARPPREEDGRPGDLRFARQALAASPVAADAWSRPFTGSAHFPSAAGS